MDQNSMDAVMDRLDSLLDVLEGVPRAAHDMYREYNGKHLREHSPRSQASCIYDHMVWEATRRFDGKRGVRIHELRGLKLWLIGAPNFHTVVRWKKMDEDGTTRNYPTKQAKDFDDNVQISGIPAKPTRVSIGYFLDRTQQQIERVLVARPNGKRSDWCAAIIPPSMRAKGAQKWEEVSGRRRLGG